MLIPFLIVWLGHVQPFHHWIEHHWLVTILLLLVAA